MQPVLVSYLYKKKKQIIYIFCLLCLNFITFNTIESKCLRFETFRFLRFERLIF